MNGTGGSKDPDVPHRVSNPKPPLDWRGYDASQGRLPLIPTEGKRDCWSGEAAEAIVAETQVEYIYIDSVNRNMKGGASALPRSALWFFFLSMCSGGRCSA